MIGKSDEASGIYLYTFFLLVAGSVFVVYSSLQSNTPEWTHPSILSQLKMWIGSWGYLLWGSFLISMLWFMLWLWRNSTPHIAALWTLAITVLVTPYVWSWDFVLLLPLLVYILSKANWKGWFLLIIGYVLVWGGIAVIQLSDNFHNSRFWWVPIGCIGGFLIIYLLSGMERRSLFNETNHID